MVRGAHAQKRPQIAPGAPYAPRSPTARPTHRRAAHTLMLVCRDRQKKQIVDVAGDFFLPRVKVPLCYTGANEKLALLVYAGAGFRVWLCGAQRDAIVPSLIGTIKMGLGHAVLWNRGGGARYDLPTTHYPVS